MALAPTATGALLGRRLTANLAAQSAGTRPSFSFSSSSSSLNYSNTRALDRRRGRREIALSIRCSAAPAAPASGSAAPAISVTDKALNHLNKMRSEKNEDLCLRIGVKQGGCSGMSYTMEFESQANARPDDSIMEYNGFVIDPGYEEKPEFDYSIDLAYFQSQAEQQ